MKMKRWLAALLIMVLVVPMALASPPIEAQAAGSKEIEVAAPVNYTTKEKILKRINEIRKEACDEGISFEGRTLKPSDYVEIKWSTDMEEIAMTRAVEAYYSFSHTRPDGSSCFTAESSTGMTSSCEIIASMGSALGDIELWYMEKDDLVAGNEGAAGHYIALIDPDYKSIGIASAGVSVGELCGESFEGTGRDEQIYNRNAYLNVEIAVDPDNVDLEIFGDSKVSLGCTSQLLFALPVYSMSRWSMDVLPVQDVKWTSSNAKIISVDQDGIMTPHKEGKVTITAEHRGIKVTHEVTAVKGEWKQDKVGWWYDMKDGDYLRSEFAQIGGKVYFFKANGYMATLWQRIYGDWYYFGTDGVVKTDWQKIGGVWYYFDADGIMATGWVKVGDDWYYMDSSGAMKTGWVKDGSTWYYMEASGAMATGWRSVGGKWYYFNDKGAMTVGWQKVSGKWYYMDSSGAMKTGWIKDGSKWYYMEASGAMATQRWVGDYYVDKKGEMAVNKWIGEYYVGSDGKWVPGKTK